jgi:hypothetical protein
LIYLENVVTVFYTQTRPVAVYGAASFGGTFV